MRYVTWRILILIFSFCLVNRDLPGSRDTAFGIVTRPRLNGRGIVVPFLVGARPMAYRGQGGLGVKPPPPEIPKALQNRAKLNPIVKTVKNC